MKAKVLRAHKCSPRKEELAHSRYLLPVVAAENNRDDAF